MAYKPSMLWNKEILVSIHQIHWKVDKYVELHVPKHDIVSYVNCFIFST
jgi:hypothetical protein